MANRFARMIAVGAVAASIAAAGSAATASATAHPGNPAPGTGRQAAIAMLRHVKISLPGPLARGDKARLQGAPTQVPNTVVAGYADVTSSGSTYSRVFADWVQPTVTCPAHEDQEVFFLVGLDGIVSNGLEAVGTVAECHLGQAAYDTFWELGNSSGFGSSALKAGDHIGAVVSISSGTYTEKVADFTTAGNNLKQTGTCTSCADASADWIIATPQGPRGLYPIPDFGSWTPVSASATSGSTTGSISTFPDDELTMDQGTQGGYNLATPARLSSSGTSFKLSWNNSY